MEYELTDREGAHERGHDQGGASSGQGMSMLGSLAGRVGTRALQRRLAQRQAARQSSDHKSLGGESGGDDSNVDDKTGKATSGGEGGGEPSSAKGGEGSDEGSDGETSADKKSAPSGPPTVTLSKADINAKSTPAGMPNRIPPRKGESVKVSVSGFTKGATPVTVEVEGSGGAPGTVTVNGAASIDIKASKSVTLKGTAQTAPGSGGGLRLVARQGATILAASNTFTVSAIPQNYKDTFVSLLTGAKRGFVVQDDWQSDSGTFADLDETEISEQVEVTSSTGCFSGTGANNSGYLAGNVKSQDTHSSPASIMTAAGRREATQTCMFKDKRSGATDIPMKRSGYSLVRVVKAAKGGKFKFTMTKKGASVTANGIASAAGSGHISKTQDV